VYLAGYAIECALKAYLITREPPAGSLARAVELRRARGEHVPNILGADGHNLRLLLTVTGLESDLDREEARRRDWGICLKWKSTWRYDPAAPTTVQATEFIDATRRVYEWVRART